MKETRVPKLDSGFFRFVPSNVCSRSFATEEVKAEAPELTENEKKLTTEIEGLSKQVTELTEKNEELNVSLETDQS